MSGLGWDPEAPAGFQDGDFEMRELEEAGARASAKVRIMRKLRAAGHLLAAADMCPHGWCYQLDSPAAEEANDPRAGESGYRCKECGSVLTDIFVEGAPILHPCDWMPG